jgi:hypothetical protein
LIAIYTFRGLWVGRTYESLRLTKAIVAAIWGFVILMIILGNALNRHKDNQHRYETPTPVSFELCTLSDPTLFADPRSNTPLAVLVLDREGLPPVAHLGGIFLVLVDFGGINFHIHSFVLLEPWRDHSSPQVMVAIQYSTCQLERRGRLSC